MRLYTILMAGVALCALPIAANAAQVVCPEPGFTTEPNAKVEDLTGTASATSACEYTVPADNSITASITNINNANFLGYNTWESNSQTQIDGAGALTGTWSIANPDFINYDYGIFFKDGAGTNLIGFMFNELYSSGVWSSPLTDPPFTLPGNSVVHGVSHFTIARIEVDDPPPPEVPEPASLALLGLGLLGLGTARSLKRRG